VIGSAAPARAGAPLDLPPPTAAELRAAEMAERWHQKGIALVSEMIDAACGTEELLVHEARNSLFELGAPALPHLVRAAGARECPALGEPIAAIACTTGRGGPELAEMLRAPRASTLATALAALTDLGERASTVAPAFGALNDFGEAETMCPAAAPVLAAAVPALGKALHRLSGGPLHDALWAAEKLGPRAAPLVPDLIPLLEGEEVASNIAAVVLGAIGPAAAPAVPTLRALHRRGGKWRTRAVEALGGIGPPARPALADLAPALAATLPHLCSGRPRTTAEDAIAYAIARAVPKIGGAEAEPLVADLATAFKRLHACKLVRVDEWLRGFEALGRHGAPAAPLLLSLVVDPDEHVDMRRWALAALDRVDPALAGQTPADAARVQVIRAALERKRVIFDRRDDDEEGDIQQPDREIHPSPPTSPLFDLCREEAGMPTMQEPDGLPRSAGYLAHSGFEACVISRLCGPDPATYRATMTKCCASYRDWPPWFCSAREPTWPPEPPRATPRRRAPRRALGAPAGRE
jgi:hypothetical protein